MHPYLETAVWEGEANMENQTPLYHAEMAIFHAAMALEPFCKSEKKLKKFARHVASLNDTGGPEDIDGVLFDFRDPLLNPHQWGLATISHSIMNVPGLGSDGIDRDTPSIWFPWFGKFDHEKYKKRVIKYQREEGKHHIDIEAILSTNMPQYFVESGDTLRIHSVTDTVLNYQLEHSHDSIVKNVMIEISRADGSVEVMSTAYIVTGHQAVLSAPPDIDDHITTIMWRIAHSYGLDSLDKLSEVTHDQSVRSRAASVGLEVYDCLQSLKSTWHSIAMEAADPGSADFMKDIIQGIDRAAMLGFLWAKAEAEIELKPLAKSALLRKESNILGGSASGDARRKKAEIGWKAIARRMAFEVRSEHPD
jgi:hypothetical protein